MLTLLSDSQNDCGVALLCTLGDTPAAENITLQISRKKQDTTQNQAYSIRLNVFTKFVL